VVNGERVVRDVVVIGASAGGLAPLTALVENLPRDYPGTIGVVVHLRPTYESQLARLLARRAKLPIVEATDSLPATSGYIYIAPPDRHMVVTGAYINLTRDPKEHRVRPAINPLFLSAARSHGPRVVGILLSGNGSDGVAGLIAIKKAGGVSLVQDPEQAEWPTMPRTAIQEDDVDAVLSQDELAPALVLLAAGLPLNGTMQRTRPD
jgi:two-component system chemotaxis response regulator CheB